MGRLLDVARRAYRIRLARLAGLPRSVIDRAAEVLSVLEKTDHKVAVDGATLDELPLFAAARPKGYTAARSEPSSLDRAIDAINPDELAPKAALETLYRLKALRSQHGKD